MTRPRKQQVAIEDTPYYHIVSRCVRRAFLCGTDSASGQCYDHRRLWIEHRIRLLSSLFGIDIGAYAVMSNHLHIVVKLCPETVVGLTQQEVVQRWSCLFKCPLLVQRWRNGEMLPPPEQATVDDCIAEYRRRLASLSWFMKCLNEPIARQANQEDACTGHFWEGRYKSQPLLTEEALLACMAYVDLNPIRARMADTPETSDHTSIKERITPEFDLAAAVQEQITLGALLAFDLPLKPLLEFEGEVRDDEQHGILFSLEDYLHLVDATGRCVREGKRGSIPANLPPFLQRLTIDSDTWLSNATPFEALYRTRFSRSAKPKACAA